MPGRSREALSLFFFSFSFSFFYSFLLRLRCSAVLVFHTRAGLQACAPCLAVFEISTIQHGKALTFFFGLCFDSRALRVPSPLLTGEKPDSTLPLWLCVAFHDYNPCLKAGAVGRGSPECRSPGPCRMMMHVVEHHHITRLCLVITEAIRARPEADGRLSCARDWRDCPPCVRLPTGPASRAVCFSSLLSHEHNLKHVFAAAVHGRPCARSALSRCANGGRHSDENATPENKGRRKRHLPLHGVSPALRPLLLPPLAVACFLSLSSKNGKSALFAGRARAPVARCPAFAQQQEEMGDVGGVGRVLLPLSFFSLLSLLSPSLP